MQTISAEKFLLWKKKQILKGGDERSFLLLIDSLIGISKSKLFMLKVNPKDKLNLKINLDSIEKIWEKHLDTHEPIEYISGFCYWRDLKLQVSNKVLIPRPETELIIDIASEIFKDKSGKIVFADLGTGSGAISISLAMVNPNWVGLATDIDENALNIADGNFKNCSNQSNLSFFCGHWWKPLKDFKFKIDLAISNPPYIPKNVYLKLPSEVRNFEPKIALLGGIDGLMHIKEIIEEAPLYLKEKGWLIIENHFDQGTSVKQLFLENKFKYVKVLNDFSGIGRFTIGRYK